MYATTFTYRVKPGQEKDLIAYYEEWQKSAQARSAGFISAELLRDSKDPRSFVNIARFETEEALRSLAADPGQDAWYRRLVSLTEAEPVFIDCEIAWQITHNDKLVTSL